MTSVTNDTTDPPKRSSGMSKLRARMQLLRDSSQLSLPPSDIKPTGHDTNKGVEDTARQTAHAENRSQASTTEAKLPAIAPLESVHRPSAPVNISRNSNSSWDRRFRHISTAAPSSGAQSPAPAPPQHRIEPAAQQANVLQQGARSIAEVKPDPDLGTQDEDPWSWDVAEPTKAGRKKRQAKPSTSAESASEALPDSKQPKKLNSTKPSARCVKLPSHDAAGHQHTGACPDLSNAPTHGPDEPLLLDYPGNDAGNAPLRLSVPSSINMYLRDYQRDGVAFFFRQYAQNQGGILGDDMGLGKTVQTIAFCAALLEKTGTSSDSLATPNSTARRCPILIVAPTSVLTNWQREFNTWGAFRVALCHGKQNIREAMLAAVKEGQFEILLTSYDIFRINLEDKLKIGWHVAIFDEAHKLKNRSSKTYEASCQLPTKLRYGLTGTAMQNDYDELHTLLEWAVPGGLGERHHFQEYYEAPIKMAQKKDIDESALGRGRARQSQLNKLVEKFLLRRTKDSTIKDQLPKKTDNIVFCEMSLLQHRAYERTLDSPDFQLLVHFDELCTCGSGVRRASCCFQTCDTDQGGILWPQFHCCQCDFPADAFTNPAGCKWHKPQGCPGPRLRCPFCLVLPCLTILQKISNHLEMVKGNPQDQQDRDLRRNMKYERDTAVAEMVLGEDLDKVGGAEAENSFMTLSDTSSCGKMTALAKLLDLWYTQENANKVLVFSHSVRMLDIIERLVIMAGYVYLRLDGSTKQQDRQSKVDQFNTSASVFLFLISTTAGGLGLNLTAANRVVIVDPSWNPAHDLQAQDRAFRIGQRRDVGVFRLVSTGTLEEMVYARQIYKQQAANTAIEGARERRYFEGVKGVSGHEGELWGLANLFKLTAETVATRDIITAAERKELNYRIEAFDADNAVEQEPATGHTETADLQTEAEDFEVEDPGLYDLARRLTHNALQGATSTSPNALATAPTGTDGWSASCLGGHAGQGVARKQEPAESSTATVKVETGLGSGRQGAQLAGTDARTEMQMLQEGSMLATHRHEAILGGSRVERMLSNAAEQRLVASEPEFAHGASLRPPETMQANRGEPSRVVQESSGNVPSESFSQEPTSLAILAAWKDLPLEQMARMLLDMSAEERTHLREQYAGT